MAEEQKLEVEEPVVGWVVWKDAETEMVVLGDGDGQPQLFTSYSSAELERGLLDVIDPVTQERYDELCGKKVAVVEDVQPVKVDLVEDTHEAWVQSILAKIDAVNAKSSKWAAEPALPPPEEVVKPVSAPLEEVVKPAPASPKRTVRPKSALLGSVNEKGFVYLMRAPLAPGVYKIGKSFDPEERLQAIQRMSPIGVALECVKPTDSMSEVEALLHERFSTKRKHGEWFWLTEEDVKWIEKLDVSNASSLCNTPWTEWPQEP